MTNKIAIFSGRFDPPHLGHIITLHKILTCYSKVIVPILDYEGRCLSAFDALSDFFEYKSLVFPSYMQNKVYFLINKTHFGKITEGEIKGICRLAGEDDDLSQFVYVGGNEKVNKHIESLKCIKVEHFQRSTSINATDIRNRG